MSGSFSGPIRREQWLELPLPPAKLKRKRTVSSIAFPGGSMATALHDF